MTLRWKGIHLMFFFKKKDKRKTNWSLLTFALMGAPNDKNQICGYFHVTEHHSVTGSCLMFLSDPDDRPPPPPLYLGGWGWSSKIYFLMFTFHLLFKKEFRCAWICGVLLRSQMKSCRNQIKNKNPSPSVSIWRFIMHVRVWKKRHWNPRIITLHFSWPTTGHVSTMFSAWTGDLWDSR